VEKLHGRRSGSQEASEETLAGASKAELAITLLAVPMMAGPGAIQFLTEGLKQTGLFPSGV
jgi:small neutral amino acid transporter SnatA (MarC family)